MKKDTVIMKMNKKIFFKFFCLDTKEEAVIRFRELVPDVNTITSTATSSKEERRKKNEKNNWSR